MKAELKWFCANVQVTGFMMAVINVIVQLKKRLSWLAELITHSSRTSIYLAVELHCLRYVV